MRSLDYRTYVFAHLHLDRWRDEGIDPDPKLLFPLIVKFHAIVAQNEGIPFIHCSGGINRSRFFAILHAIYEKLLEDPNAKINVAELLLASIAHRTGISKNVVEWLEKYIPLMAQRIQASKK